MAFRLPNGATFDFGATFGPTVAVSAISNAKPAVATTATNTFAVGDIVVLNTGWVKAVGRPFRVSVATTTSVTLESLDTTNVVKYPAGSGAGTIRKVATWVNIPQITGITSSGGEQQFFTFGFLEEEDDRQIPTTKSPSVLTVVVADDPVQPYVPIVELADETNDEVVQRLNMPNGDQIFYNSIASITNTPTLTRNNLMERTITLALQGIPTRYRKIGS